MSAAGCLGSDSLTGPKHGDDLPPDQNDEDGYPPPFDDEPTERSINPNEFDTTRVNGVAVPLAPIDDVYYWYARREARFVDARSDAAFRRSRVFGAVLSPATEGLPDDPVDDWPQSDRIVCYCSCPHHLSSMRAASLVENGYEEVYVIDEGFREWHARDYPVAGSDVTTVPEVHAIDGRTDTAHAWETAWARHRPSGQREATPIRDDGTYRLELSFFDVTDASMIVVETPAYTVEAPLGELTAGVVTGTNAASNDAMRVDFGSGERRSR